MKKTQGGSIMKTSVYFMLIMGLLIHFLGAADAVVLKMEAVCNVVYPPGASGNMYWADQAMTMYSQNPSNPDLEKQAVRYAEVATYGYQYSHPLTLYVELSDQGDILKYRIETVLPFIDFFNPAFTPQNPVIHYKDQITAVFDGRQRYNTTFSMEENKITNEEYADISSHNLEKDEILMRLWKGYQALIQKLPEPQSVMADTNVYEIGGDKIYIANGKKSVVSTNERFPEHGFELSLDQFQSFSFLVPNHVISKSPDRIAKYTIHKIEVLNGDAATGLFTVPEKEN